MNSLESAESTSEASNKDVLPPEEYIEHVKKVNDVFYSQVLNSDQKAAYIFTFMLAFLVTSAEGRQVFNVAHYSSGPVLTSIISAILALGSIISSLCAILVVLPQHVKKSTSLFWGTWPSHRPLLEEAAARRDPRYLFQQYLDNADVLSQIARRKYRLVTYAFQALAVTVFTYVLLLIVE
jgi:hypothetical protein